MLRVILYLFLITICINGSGSSVVPQEEKTIKPEIENAANANKTVSNVNEIVSDANENNRQDKVNNDTVQFEGENLKGDNITFNTTQDDSEEATVENATTEQSAVKDATSEQAATEEATTVDPVEDISELITGARNPIARVFEGVNSGFKNIADRASEAGRSGIHFMQHAGANILDGF